MKFFALAFAFSVAIGANAFATSGVSQADLVRANIDISSLPQVVLEAPEASVLSQPENVCAAQMFISLRDHLVKFAPKIDDLFKIQKQIGARPTNMDSKLEVKFVLRPADLAQDTVNIFEINHAGYSETTRYPYFEVQNGVGTHTGIPFHWDFANQDNVWYSRAYLGALQNAGYPVAEKRDEPVDVCKMSNAQFAYLMGVTYQEIEAGFRP